MDITVLFVEDEDVLRAIYERILNKFVKTLFVAENGKEGLEKYKECQPDLIITDIQMPVMDGLEMIEMIRDSDQNVRIVILSAYGETEYFMDAIKIGVNSFLLKPVETKKLIALVEDLAKGILLERELIEQELKRRLAEENLRKLNEELEKRIDDRTKDLQHEIKEKIQAETELKELNLNLEKRVKEELKKRQEQQRLLIQKSKLESMGELSAGIAHEINQPLGGISMGLDNILFKMSLGEITDHYLTSKLEALFHDIDRIRQIINHVRVFSRDQQSGLVETFQLNEVIKSAVSLVNNQYANHNIDLQLDLGEEDMWVKGNKYKIEQVLLNLLSNAKFAVEEKQKLKSAKSFKKRIRINTFISDSIVVFEVEDNGSGIYKKDLGNIFDPFFTTKDVENGTGLGLSISYGIIKEMKGHIDVESEINKFTKMKVSLPEEKGGRD
ncbi:MAG: response regulator [Chlorobi bacterium]|nr:response regulator [Chlorobiota bacterium]